MKKPRPGSRKAVGDSHVRPNTSRRPKGTDNNFGPKDKPEVRVAFLAVLAAGGSPTKASGAVGIDRRTAYTWKVKDAEFSEAWDDAVEAGNDGLEDEARRRAVDGIDKPVTVAGEREVVKEYSDTLLTLMLKGRRRAVYSDKVEHSGPNGAPIQHEITVRFVKAGTQK